MEEHHQVCEIGGADLANDLGGQLLGNIDASDVGADGGGEGFDGDVLVVHALDSR